MADRTAMRDIIILLPGIMGSVLERQGSEVWSMPRIIGPALLGNRKAFEPMVLKKDDPERETLDDGILATRLLTGIHGIHGLALGEGYKQIADTIRNAFQVVEGTPDDDRPANFIPFPYDWRRDNRVSAMKLKKLIDRKLPQWRAHMRSQEPKIILIGHSMGGLVSRYYLECLGGWEHCKALITFGTPHRGSPNALSSLCIGHKLANVELIDLVRSFTSAYQLLPIYPVLRVGDQVHRLNESDALEPFGLTRKAAAEGIAFHHEIRDAVKARDSALSSQVHPIVGTYQPTFQSAIVNNGKLELSGNLPEPLPRELDTGWVRDGDGTVPFLSAIPIELSLSARNIYYPEKHAWLPNNDRAMEDLCRRLAEMQLGDFLERMQGGAYDQPAPDSRPALRLDLDTLYRKGDTIRPRVTIVNQGEAPGKVTLTLTPDDGGKAIVQELEPDGKGWSAELRGVQPGLYRAMVRTFKRGPRAPQPVHDVLEVVA